MLPVFVSSHLCTHALCAGTGASHDVRASTCMTGAAVQARVCMSPASDIAVVQVRTHRLLG
eukprot:6040786-Pleurochrysis_carterae.AAC.1